MKQLSRNEMKLLMGGVDDENVGGGCSVSCETGYYACCNTGSCKCVSGSPHTCSSGGIGSTSCSIS